MDADKVKIYQACDKAIKALNRANVELFGRMKMAKWDEIHVIRTVRTVYEQSETAARKRYRTVAIEAYVVGLMVCGFTEEEARRRARKEITQTWVDDILERTDPVTEFRFDAEADRKAARLAEQLEITTARSRAIDVALRYWSQQLGQYAINITDYAFIKAMKNAGVKKVKWISVRDERRCQTCRTRDGHVYSIDAIPPKPHWGCRCILMPVME